MKQNHGQNTNYREGVCVACQQIWPCDAYIENRRADAADKDAAYWLGAWIVVIDVYKAKPLR